MSHIIRNQIFNLTEGSSFSSSSWTPQIPRSLVATTFDSTRIDLVWDDNGETESDGIRIKISTDNITFVEKGTVNLGVQAYSATGLIPGILYFFQVFAYKGSKESTGSNTFLEVTAPEHLTFSTSTGIVKTGYVYTGTGTGYLDQYALADEALTGDFTITVQRISDAFQMIALRDDASNTAFNDANGGYNYFIFGSGVNYYRGYAGGNVADTGIALALGDLVRLRRTTNIVYAEYYRGGTWYLMYQFGTTNSGTLYAQISIDDPVKGLKNPIKDLEKCPVSMRFINSTFIFDGNSLMKGYTDGITYYSPSDYLKILLPFAVYFLNDGQDGGSTQGMINDAAAHIDAFFIPGVNNFVIACEVGNDIIINNLTARQAVDNFWTYCDGRKTVGFDIFTVNMQDRSTLDNTTRLAANTLLLAEYVTHSDYFIDLASHSELADHNDLTYFQADGIHNTDNGYQIWARWFKQALLNYLFTL